MHYFRRRGVSALIVVAVLALGACRAPDLGPEEADAAGFPQLRELRQREVVLLPTSLPPEFVSLGAATGDEVALADFHSTGEPLVTICNAPPARCHELMRFGAEIRTVEIGGAEALVGTSATEDAGGGAALSEEAAAFWREVEFTADEPAWLTEP